MGAVDWQGEQTWYSETGSNMLVSAPSNNYGEDPAIFTTDVSGEILPIHKFHNIVATYSRKSAVFNVYVNILIFRYGLLCILLCLF